MWNDPAGTHIFKTALDAFCNGKLARNEIGYRLAREVGFCSVCLTCETPKLPFQSSRKTHD